MSKTYFLPDMLNPPNWNSISTSSSNVFPECNLDSILAAMAEFKRLTAPKPEVTMPTHPDALAFLKMIEEQPEDNSPKLVYADWLEERGDPESEAWRWLVQEKKRPHVRLDGLSVWPERNSPYANQEIVLPRRVLDFMSKKFDVQRNYGFVFISAAEALVAAAQAYVLARKTGWDPYAIDLPLRTSMSHSASIRPWFIDSPPIIDF